MSGFNNGALWWQNIDEDEAPGLAILMLIFTIFLLSLILFGK